MLWTPAFAGVTVFRLFTSPSYFSQSEDYRTKVLLVNEYELRDIPSHEENGDEVFSG